MNSITWLSGLTGAAFVLLIVHIGLLWKNLSVARSLHRSDERIGHLSDALGLLTETSESGFRTMAAEIERLAGATGRTREPRVSVSRLSAAARRGRSTAEIAAAERVSEGEVALRLHLAEHRTKASANRGKVATPKGAPDGTVRAD